MPDSPMNRMIGHFRRTVLARDVGVSDGELLGEFVERKDGDALAALITRHGPMVWGVCRRRLNHHDAEDAFQATFCVLVRKAASICPRGMVGNWLYGVAYHTALQARAVARQHAREVQVTAMPEPAPTLQDHRSDQMPALDEELARLPAIYRAVVVVCDLEGRPRAEAARQLGVPEGTVGGRLARARALLAKRLLRRGVGLAGVAVSTASLQSAASAYLPAALLANTIAAASQLATGQAVTGLVSIRVATLADGVPETMFMTKTKSVLTAGLIVGLALGGLGVGTGLSSSPAARAQPPAASPQATTSHQEPKDEEELVKKLKELIQEREKEKTSDDTKKDREELMKKLKEAIQEREAEEKIQKVIQEMIQKRELETRLKQLFEKREKQGGDADKKPDGGAKKDTMKDREELVEKLKELLQQQKDEEDRRKVEEKLLQMAREKARRQALAAQLERLLEDRKKREGGTADEKSP